MLELPLESAIKGVTLDKIQEPAIEALEEMLFEGIDHARLSNFPVHSYFKDAYVEIMENEGFIDTWVSLIFFCAFAQGISIGRGDKKIKVDDIQKTKDNICEKWPDCTVVRLEKFSEAIQIVSRWHGKHFGMTAPAQ